MKALDDLHLARYMFEVICRDSEKRGNVNRIKFELNMEKDVYQSRGHLTAKLDVNLTIDLIVPALQPNPESCNRSPNSVRYHHTTALRMRPTLPRMAGHANSMSI